MGLIEKLHEANRMNYNEFVRRVERYIKRKGISLNGAIPNRDLRKGYQDNMYPSQFVKKYVKQLNDAQKKGGFYTPNNDE